MAGLKMVDAGRVSIAKRIITSNICAALGGGSPSWASPPPDPATSDTALVAPIAMIRPTQKAHVAPDANGLIEMSNGTKWSLSQTPTRYIYVIYKLQFSEGPTDQYRELGIYLDPTFAGNVTAGQNYIPWAQVYAPGDFLCPERFNMIDGAETKETFERILVF